MANIAIRVARRIARAARWLQGRMDVSLPAKTSVDAAGSNRVRIARSARVPRKMIRFEEGENNSVVIAHRTRLIGATIIIKGSNNRLLIGRNCKFTGRILISGSNQTVSIGQGSTFENVMILSAEGCSVSIGAFCMFSRNIEIRTTDAHSLVDRRTGLRLNPASSIAIGNHVWVGVGSVINKGVALADDCVVGAMSFVNKTFTEPGVVIAGSPAVVVRKGITWNRKRLSHFPEAELNNWRAEIAADANAKKQRRMRRRRTVATDGNSPGTSG